MKVKLFRAFSARFFFPAEPVPLAQAFAFVPGCRFCRSSIVLPEPL
jgi:hypothetical protein